MNNIKRISVNGFTVLELVLVILIIGVIAVATVPNWTATQQGVEYEARRLLGDLRYTQAMSITTGQRYRLVITSSNSYQILNQSGSPVMLPTGGTSLTLSNNITFGSLTNLPNSLVAYDSNGAPYVDTGSPGTALSSTAVIPLVSGSATRNVSITPGTGYGGLS